MLEVRSSGVEVEVRRRRSFLFATFSFVETCGYVHNGLVNPNLSFERKRRSPLKIGVEPVRPWVCQDRPEARAAADNPNNPNSRMGRAREPAFARKGTLDEKDECCETN